MTGKLARDSYAGRVTAATATGSPARRLELIFLTTNPDALKSCSTGTGRQSASRGKR